MFRPHYDRHLIDTLLGRNHKKTITEEDCYMLDRPYMNAVDLEILPRLASNLSSHSGSSRISSSPQRYSHHNYHSSTAAAAAPTSSSSSSSSSNHYYSTPRENKFADTDEIYLPDRYATGITPAGLTDMLDTEALLRLKWMDNTPRMSRLRETRRRRLINKLEQYELWDQEQEQKNRQHELAREQRYKSIVDRLKSQEFCVNQMKKRHENDLETTRELENYSNDHLYFDCLDDPKTFYKGPVSQYRQFSSEMEEKVKALQNDLDTLNPRQKINQAILPRIERTREIYSQEPEIFTRSGRRVLKRPKLDRHSVAGSLRLGSESSRRSTSNDAERLEAGSEASGAYGSAAEKFLTESQRRLRNILNDSGPKPKPQSSRQLKPIIHTDDATRKLDKMRLSDNELDNADVSSSSSSAAAAAAAAAAAEKKAVYFNDNVDYRSPPSLANDD